MVGNLLDLAAWCNPAFVMNLSLNEQRQLSSAEGWLELGNWEEANQELKQITRPNRAHPAILRTRWNIWAKAEKWEMAAHVAGAIVALNPDDSWGYIHFAYSLHVLKRTQEALAILLPMAEKFPKQFIISYNLACYCCQLGKLAEGLEWLEQAIAIGGLIVRLSALKDPDLKPLYEGLNEG